LEEILTICKNNPDKKILIVSKRGEFASTITKYINANSDIKCLDYHDTIEEGFELNEYGETVLVKSGVNKGKPKIIKATAISTINLAQFNRRNNSKLASVSNANSRLTNCLSIKNSSNVKLETAVDLVIFTSAFIDDIITFKTRFANVVFNGVTTINYKVYCRNTIESKHLSNQKESHLITVIAEDDNNISYDETNDTITI